MTRALDVVTIGETLALFRSDGVGPVAHNTRFDLSIGGAESNVAIAVTRLGGIAAWIGRVGADSFGDLVTRELRAEGVQVHAVRDPGHPTALMIREVRTSNLARVTYYRAHSAGAHLTPTDVPLETVRSAKILHVTGITPALSLDARAAVFAAVDDARANGVKVSFDVNHRSALWDNDSAVEVYGRLVERADLVFAGVEEAGMLVHSAEDLDLESLAQAIAELGPAQVIIKRGPAGCLAIIDGETYDAPAVQIDPLDTVGAGDAFVGGYLADLCAGADPVERLITANAAGAFVCMSPGDWAGLPARAELGLLEAPDPVIR